MEHNHMLGQDHAQDHQEAAADPQSPTQSRPSTHNQRQNMSQNPAHGHGHSQNHYRNDMLPPTPGQGPPQLPEASHSPAPPSYSSSSSLSQPIPIPSPSTSTAPSANAFADDDSRALPPLSPSPPNNDRDRMLPPLSSVTGGHTLPIRNNMAHGLNPQMPSQWPPAPPLQTQHKMDSPSTMDLDTSSNSVISAASPDGRTEGRSASVNLDDPDVRLAAEALGDLRADFVSSPPNQPATLPISPPAPVARLNRSQSPQVPEPLLALLTTSHPLLATTIEGATSAYGGAKNFSPRFKSGAEYVEGYLTPIANTVGSVGRVTGVEGGVRWFLGAGRRQGSDLEAGSSKKRRKVDAAGSEPSNKRIEAEGMEPLPIPQTEAGNLQDSFPPTPKGDRRLSFASTIDTLPAYDDHRSPAYTETMDTQSTDAAARPNSAWQSRLIMSTSGLSVAMSDESLRSLKYCLRWLRWANDHIGSVIGSLKTTLEQYDRPSEKEMLKLESAEQEKDLEAMDTQVDEKHPEPSRAELATRINSLKGDVVKTLQDAINMVSRYAGGALPENARELVRRHLTSLPKRFHLATMSENNGQNPSQDQDSAVRDGAHKVLLLAKEGLDMVSQVSGIVDGTIVSAEEWCERMGKKKRESNESEKAPVLPQTEPNGDVKMG